MVRDSARDKSDDFSFGFEWRVINSISRIIFSLIRTIFVLDFRRLLGLIGLTETFIFSIVRAGC